MLPLYTHIIPWAICLNNYMKRILNHLSNPVVVIMILFLVIFSLNSCTTISNTETPTENESIITSEPVDIEIRDQAIISVWTCVFAPSSCGDELESTQ